jgi:hypothetical protein
VCVLDVYWTMAWSTGRGNRSEQSPVIGPDTVTGALETKRRVPGFGKALSAAVPSSISSTFVSVS